MLSARHAFLWVCGRGRVHLMLIFCFTEVHAKFTLSNSIYAQCNVRIPGAATLTTNFSHFDMGGIEGFAEIWGKQRCEVA